MNIAFNDIIMPTTAARNSSQAKIEGNIPLPKSISRVLTVAGKTNITGTEIMENKVLTDGKIVLDIICTDTNGNLFSFTSSAGFSHTIECMGAKPTMTANVTAQLINISAKPNGDQLSLDATLDIMCRVEDNSPKAMLSPNGNAEDLEVKALRYVYKEREKVGYSSSRMREEIVANEVKEFIFSSADAIIRDISQTAQNARVSGVMSLNALCLGKNNKPFRFQQNIPFTVDVPIEDNFSVSFTGKAEVIDLNLRTMGDEYRDTGEFGLAILEATLSVELYSLTESELTLTTDAFSPKESFDCNKRDVQLLLYKETVEQKTICHESMGISGDASKFNEVVFTDIRPFVASATKGENCIIVEGIAFANMLYTDTGGNLHSAKDELPFSLRLPTGYENIELDARAICTGASITGISENGVDMSISIHIQADIYELCDIQIVESVTEAPPRERKKGFVICFAADGECVYDIAKQYGISQSKLLSENSQLSATLNWGDKAVVLV